MGHTWGRVWGNTWGTLASNIDAIPNPVVLAAIDNAELNTTYTAQAPITGVDIGVNLTAIGVELSNDGINWNTTLTSTANTLVRASVTTGSENGTAYSTSGTINGASVSFTVTTSGAYLRSGRHMVDTGV